jgi:glycerol-3-phosphate dehydrogenase
MNRFIENYNNKVYDIVVIGGGVTGGAVAYEAASRGFSVALVEKDDFGGATSAATSKLIHGGLRYLANYEFGLVRESLRERKILENIAPNLVHPIPFLVPLYDHGLRNKKLVQPGMILYDLLSFDKGLTWDKTKRIPVHHFISKDEVMKEEQIVDTNGLTGAVVYYDCASLSPERLTLAFIKSAVKHGADVSNYSKVERFCKDAAGRITGVEVQDMLNSKMVTLHGRLTINCGGPWADKLLDKASGKPGGPQIKRSEGIHIITRLLTNHFAVGGLTKSGRACNLTPWRGHTLIGPTDTEYKGDPDNYHVTKESVEAYVKEVNETFQNKFVLQNSDVLYAYGGLRPLVGSKEADVRKVSRKYEVFDNAKDGLTGLITVEGGKYTTSRNLAEHVVKLVCRKFDLPYKKSITDTVHLAGCEIKDMTTFIASAKSAHPELGGAAVDFLGRMYGTELNQVLALGQSDKKWSAPLNADGEMLSQVVFAIRSEMARTLTDIFLRRTGIGTLGHPGDTVLERVAEIAAQELNWNKDRLDRELAAADKALSLPS